MDGIETPDSWVPDSCLTHTSSENPWLSSPPSKAKDDPGLLEGTAPSPSRPPHTRDDRVAPHSLALGAIAVHAVLDGLVAWAWRRVRLGISTARPVSVFLDGPFNLRCPLPGRVVERDGEREIMGWEEQRDQASGYLSGWWLPSIGFHAHLVHQPPTTSLTCTHSPSTAFILTHQNEHYMSSPNWQIHLHVFFFN